MIKKSLHPNFKARLCVAIVILAVGGLLSPTVQANVTDRKVGSDQANNWWSIHPGFRCSGHVLSDQVFPYRMHIATLLKDALILNLSCDNPNSAYIHTRDGPYLTSFTLNNFPRAVAGTEGGSAPPACTTSLLYRRYLLDGVIRARPYSHSTRMFSTYEKARAFWEAGTALTKRESEDNSSMTWPKKTYSDLLGSAAGRPTVEAATTKIGVVCRIKVIFSEQASSGLSASIQTERESGKIRLNYTLGEQKYQLDVILGEWVELNLKDLSTELSSSLVLSEGNRWVLVDELTEGPKEDLTELPKLFRKIQVPGVTYLVVERGKR